MTEQEIKEGNEIIAIYEGWKFMNSQWEYEDIDKWACMKSIKEAKFNTDWNWIMDVLKKLLPELRAINRGNAIVQIPKINTALLSLDISKVFEAAVKAIQELNKLKDENT